MSGPKMRPSIPKTNSPPIIPIKTTTEELEKTRTKTFWKRLFKT